MRGKQRESELLSTGRAAELLGMSRQHVVDLCERGLLPCVRVGTHRRIRRDDLEVLVAERLTREQERTLWLHRVVAAKLVLDPPGVLEKAEGNLRRLQQVHPRGMARRWLAEWQRVLAGDLDSLLDTLTSSAPRAVELRQNSPFAGVLSEDERLRTLERFREHWREEHAA